MPENKSLGFRELVAIAIGGMVATGVSVVLVSYLSNIYFDIRKKYVTKADKIEKC